MAATYTVRINGIDRAGTHVLYDGFRINEITNGINTLAIIVGSEDASYRPLKRQTIEVEEDDGTSPVRLIFGGVITSVREEGWGQTADGIDAILLHVTADDYRTLAKRRFVTESVPAGTLKAALQVLEPYLTAYGVTLDPGQVNGPSLDAIEWEVVRLDDCLNFLATLTAKYGAPFTWKIGYDLVLGMYQTGTIAAPWNLLESDFQTTYSHVGDIEVEPTDENYANKIILYCGSGKVVTRTDIFTPSVPTATFTLTYQLVGPNAPGLPPIHQTFGNSVGRGYVTFNGVIETLDEPQYNSIWEYDVTTNTITKVIGPIPTAGDTVEISYDGELKMVVVAENAAEIALYGLWEDKILAPELEDPTLAQAVADAELARRIQTGLIVRFSTRRLPAPEPGQSITITVPKRNISGAFTVTDVQTESEPGNVNELIRRVTCNSTIHEQSHQTLTRWWSEKDTTGIATPAGSYAVPDLPLNSVQYNEQYRFGGAAHVLYGDLFWDQPDTFTSPPEVRTKGLVFVTNGGIGDAGHIGLTDPQRLEMGMLGSGDFSMDMFGIDASILINATGDIILTAGVPEVSPIGSPGEGLAGGVHLVGAESISERVAASSGITGGVTTRPGNIGDSFSRFHRLNVLDGVAGFYRTVSSLPFSIQVTGTETDNEFWTYIVTAGTGTIFLPWIGSAGTPNYRSFPNTLVGRMYWIVNDGGGTLTVDAGTAGTNINDASTITLADKAAVKVQRHDDGWRILASFGTVTGGGAGGVTPGGNDKDVQFNDGGVLGGESQFEWDKTTDQLTISRDLANNTSTLRVRDDGGLQSVIALQSFSTTPYADITFGWERSAGVDTARTNTPGQVYWAPSAVSPASPSSTAIGMDLFKNETPGSPLAASLVVGHEITEDGIFNVWQEGGLGTGYPGMGFYAESNTDGSGAPAWIGLENQDGTPYYEWPDQEGYPHWGDFTPSEGASPSPADSNFMTIGNVPELRVVIKSADESVTSSSYQDDDELFFSVGADEQWIVEWHIFYQAATADDIKIAFSAPTGATTRWGVSGLETSVTSFFGNVTAPSHAVFTDLGHTFGGAGASTPVAFMVHMSLSTSSTTGNVVFRWARNSGSGTVTVLAGSYLKATKVA